MENGWLKLDFVWRIWKIWTGLDTIRVFQISYRQWLAKGGFSVANFGKFTFEQKFPKFSYQSNISFYFYLTFRLTPTSEWQNVVRHKKIINVTVPSRDGTDFVLQKLIINNTKGWSKKMSSVKIWKWPFDKNRLSEEAVLLTVWSTHEYI